MFPESVLRFGSQTQKYHEYYLYLIQNLFGETQPLTVCVQVQTDKA